MNAFIVGIAPVEITAKLDVFAIGDCAAVRANMYGALVVVARENTILLNTDGVASSGVTINDA